MHEGNNSMTGKGKSILFLCIMDVERRLSESE